ncbi:hypothetical protein NQZ68_025541 [Dissostichus eleginoides]|nr:hypothetical protein NQZ68_025541 [Dissostichus eleginoides]
MSAQKEFLETPVKGTIVCAAEALDPVTCGAEGAAAPLGSLEVQWENSGLYWQAMKRMNRVTSAYFALSGVTGYTSGEPFCSASPLTLGSGVPKHFPQLCCHGDGSVCRRQSRVWSKLAGTEEEAAVWTGWTAFSSRAFQNLPGASLKQKDKNEEEEGVGLPVGCYGPTHCFLKEASHKAFTTVTTKTLIISSETPGSLRRLKLRGMWLSAGQSPALSPPEELDPQTLPHSELYEKCWANRKLVVGAAILGGVLAAEGAITGRVIVVEKIVTMLHRGPEGAEARAWWGGGVLSQIHGNDQLGICLYGVLSRPAAYLHNNATQHKAAPTQLWFTTAPHGGPGADEASH